MKNYTPEELKEILELHKKWLLGEELGIRANLNSTDLRSANLSYADLRFADLRSANLSSAFGNTIHIKSLQCEKYNIVYTHNTLYIGCKSHLIEEWKNFTDEEISKMDKGALEWWKVWKPIIMNIIEISPAIKD